MDWVRFVTEKASIGPFLFIERVAQSSNLSPSSVRRAFARLQSRGLVERVTQGLFLNKIVSDVSPNDFVNVLRPHAYVSLESALRHWGISTQSPRTLTCVGLDRPKEYHGQAFRIRFRTISPKLYWGFEEKSTRYGTYKLAHPEKALLDWIYLSLQDGTNPEMDELNLSKLNRAKLIDYANKYPSSVLRTLLPVLAAAPSVA
jgi:predicted transcriptional regulator of viral defense system